jgi:hypothetical protein
VAQVSGGGRGACGEWRRRPWPPARSCDAMLWRGGGGLRGREAAWEGRRGARWRRRSRCATAGAEGPAAVSARGAREGDRGRERGGRGQDCEADGLGIVAERGRRDS